MFITVVGVHVIKRFWNSNIRWKKVVSECATKLGIKMADSKSLKPHATIPKPDGPVLVCILDGYGENEFKDTFNAVEMAETPCFDKLRANTDRFRYVWSFRTLAFLRMACSSPFRYRLCRPYGIRQQLRSSELVMVKFCDNISMPGVFIRTSPG